MKLVFSDFGLSHTIARRSDVCFDSRNPWALEKPRRLTRPKTILRPVASERELRFVTHTWGGDRAVAKTFIQRKKPATVSSQLGLSERQSVPSLSGFFLHDLGAVCFRDCADLQSAQWRQTVSTMIHPRADRLFSLQATPARLREVRLPACTIQTSTRVKAMATNILTQINIQVTPEQEPELVATTSLMRQSHPSRRLLSSKTPSNSTLINYLHSTLSMDKSFTKAFLFYVKSSQPTNKN